MEVAATLPELSEWTLHYFLTDFSAVQGNLAVSVRQETLKNRCIQLGKKAIKEAFPNILTFTSHFTRKTSNNFFVCFHYFVPTFFVIITTSTFPFLLLPSIFCLYLISSTPTKSISTTYLTPVRTPKEVDTQI